MEHKWHRSRIQNASLMNYFQPKVSATAGTSLKLKSWENPIIAEKYIPPWSGKVFELLFGKIYLEFMILIFWEVFFFFPFKKPKVNSEAWRKNKPAVSLRSLSFSNYCYLSYCYLKQGWEHKTGREVIHASYSAVQITISNNCNKAHMNNRNQVLIEL